MVFLFFMPEINLTFEGKKQLARWVDDLQKARNEIDNLLTACKQQGT